MLRRLAAYLVRGRLEAACWGGALLVLAVLLGGFQLVVVASSVPATLAALRSGAWPGTQVALAGAAIAVSLLALFDNLILQLWLALLLWLATLGCALVLRETESQGLMLAAATAIAILFSLMVRLLAGDPELLWGPIIERWMGQRTPESEEFAAQLLPLFNAVMAGTLLLSTVGTLWIARWLQAVLYMPGGFAREFRRLRLPRALVLLPLALLLSPAHSEAARSVLQDLVILTTMAYLLAGVAAVHDWAKTRALPGGTLLAFYLLLFLLLATMPLPLLLLAGVGFFASLRGPEEKRPS